MKKTELMELVQRLPDDEPVDLERLMYTLYVRRKIEEGLAAADAGDVISDEEFAREIASWHV